MDIFMGRNKKTLELEVELIKHKERISEIEFLLEILRKEREQPIKISKAEPKKRGPYKKKSKKTEYQKRAESQFEKMSKLNKKLNKEK